MISDIDVSEALKNLGERLKQLRISRGDTQETAALRLGITVPTLRAMEKGSPKVSIGLVATALSNASRLQELDQIATPPKLSFDTVNAAGRQRAQRTRRVKTT